MAQFDYSTGRQAQIPIPPLRSIVPSGPPDDSGSVRRALNEDAAAKEAQTRAVENIKRYTDK